MVDPEALGEPIAQNTVEFSWNGYDIIQGQTFYAVLVESADVTLDGLDQWEQATTDKLRLADSRRAGTRRSRPRRSEPSPT